jgi:hypothetical protein
LPLMNGWTDIVQGSVNWDEAKVLGLEPGLTSEAFEEKLGRFFAWVANLDLCQESLSPGGKQRQPSCLLRRTFLACGLVSNTPPDRIRRNGRLATTSSGGRDGR